MIANRNSFEPHSTEPLPGSSRVYGQGKLYPDIRVPFREIHLSPTKSFNGRAEANPALRVYDCFGPWGDSKFHGQVDTGLPALRRDWILARSDVEPTAVSYRPVPGRSDAPLPDTLKRQPLRAKTG